MSIGRQISGIRRAIVLHSSLQICQRYRAAACLVVVYAILHPNPGVAQQVEVRHKEGLVHGFLSLRTPEGKLLADGDLIQNAVVDRVTSRLVFHFKDGSLHDETAVFSQRGQFRLLTDHLVQKGPAHLRQPSGTSTATASLTSQRQTVRRAPSPSY